MEKPIYITKKDVARLLNVSESTVYRWNKTRYIPSSFQLGPNRVVWDRREIEAWILSRKQLTTVIPINDSTTTLAQGGQKKKRTKRKKYKMQKTQRKKSKKNKTKRKMK